MGPFGFVEQESTGDSFEDAVGDAGEVAALQTGVVVDAHPGEDGDLFAAQAGHPPVGTMGRQSDVLWGDAGAAGGEKLLADAQVKLDSVVSDITGVSSRLILTAMCDGERDPDVLADLAKQKLRAKIAQLRQAVPGRFSDHHALLVRELLAHIDDLAATEARLDARVDELMDPFVAARELLMTIPGIGKRNAEIVIAEIFGAPG
jgi:hypothetical protein